MTQPATKPDPIAAFRELGHRYAPPPPPPPRGRWHCVHCWANAIRNIFLCDQHR